jgi:hypothetical protein
LSYKYTDNSAKLDAATRQKANLALRFIAEAIVNTSTPKTPKKTGRLRADVLKQVLGLHARIIWDKVYATTQEYVQHKNYTTPGTGPHFAENAVRQEVNNSVQHFRKAGLL